MAMNFSSSTGGGESVQLSAVQTYSEPWVEFEVDLGEEGSDLVDGWCAGNRARRLFSL
jgi:hypothetical protein